MGQGWSIARRLFLANALFIIAMTVFVGTAAFVDARDRGFVAAEERMLSVASAIADNPLVLEASRATDPSAVLQPYALRVTADTGLDFITIMSPDRTRWTHPTDSEIGRPYIGTVTPALSGEPFTETTTGTLGPSVRAVVPITDEQGAVQGLVAAGVKTRTLSIALSARLPAVLAVAQMLLAAGTVAAWLLGRYLSRVTLGWAPNSSPSSSSTTTRCCIRCGRDSCSSGSRARSCSTTTRPPACSACRRARRPTGGHPLPPRRASTG